MPTNAKQSIKNHSSFPYTMPAVVAAVVCHYFFLAIGFPFSLAISCSGFFLHRSLFHIIFFSSFILLSRLFSLDAHCTSHLISINDDCVLNSWFELASQWLRTMMQNLQREKTACVKLNVPTIKKLFSEQNCKAILIVSWLAAAVFFRSHFIYYTLFVCFLVWVWLQFICRNHCKIIFAWRDHHCCCCLFFVYSVWLFYLCWYNTLLLYCTKVYSQIVFH